MTWLRIGWFYAVGVLAAAQLGKLSSLATPIGQALDLHLSSVALVISLLELAGALLGLAAGRIVARLGLRRSLVAGLVLLTLAGLGQGLSTSSGGLLAWRVLESVGYLAIVVAAPVLIFHSAREADRDSALALWSSFVPVGVALGAMSAGLLAELWSWRTALVAIAATAGLACLATWAVPVPAEAATRPRAARSRLPPPRAWALSAAFGCYALFEVGMLALLPSFLVEQTGAGTGLAGVVTGLASFATLAGSIVAAWHRRRQRSGTGPLLMLALLLPAALLFLLFRPEPGLAAAATVAILLNAISGIFPGLAFALLPKVAGREGLIGASGLLTQFGASGSLLGPPVYALLAAWWGWQGAALAGSLASLVCLLLMRAALRPAASRSGRRFAEGCP
ncbi:MFS transporter [Geminicoccus flavidas]|uniref:MFS transporter n=1 Tax=Geminicoccus flavidas TaxID=2506407 RepID=UPI001358C65A|nr:MFS transporter [Geminicoccus flavidas]